MTSLIGVCKWSLDGYGAEALLQAARLGFGAIHLDSADLGEALSLEHAALRDDYLRAAKETGVQITALSPGKLNDYGLSSPAGSPNAIRCRDLIRVSIDAAAAMGVSLVYLPSFRAGEIFNDGDLGHTAEALAEACAYAEGRPVAVATENTLGTDGNLRLLEAAGRPPNLCVLLDTQNVAMWGFDAAAVTDALWPYLSDQVHVKDGSGGQMGNALLGEGEARFGQTAARLRAHDFAGALISENDYLGERQANAARDIATMTEIFR